MKYPYFIDGVAYNSQSMLEWFLMYICKAVPTFQNFPEGLTVNPFRSPYRSDCNTLQIHQLLPIIHVWYPTFNSYQISEFLELMSQSSIRVLYVTEVTDFGWNLSLIIRFNVKSLLSLINQYLSQMVLFIWGVFYNWNSEGGGQHGPKLDT